MKHFFTELRKFILKLELFLLVSGFVFLHLRGKHYLHWVIGCLCFLVLALAFPRALQPLHRVLQKVSKWWGSLVTFIILWVVYFFALVPIGIIARLFHKDFLALRLNPEDTTYWLKREKKSPEKSGDERQY